jgi:hypothetical protein
LEDSGAVELAKALKTNTSLEIVSIEDCKIGVKGVLALLDAITESSKIHSLFTSRLLGEVQKSASKKNWKKITDLLQAKISIFQRNAEAAADEANEEDSDSDAEEDEESDSSSDEPAASRSSSSSSAKPPPRSPVGPPPGRRAGRKPPPRSDAARPPPKKMTKSWPPKREDEEVDDEKVGDLRSLPPKSIARAKPRHSIMVGLSRSGGGTKVSELAGLLAGKPLLGTKMPPGLGGRKSVRTAEDVAPVLETLGVRTGSRQRTFSMQFTADMKIESTDSVDAKLATPSAGPAKGKRKKRTRKKIAIEAVDEEKSVETS